MKILIIDDDRALGRSLQLRLEAEGHHATHRLTAEEGLAETAAGACEMVFLDLKLPDLDGIQVLGRLAEQAPGVPVVMITAQQEMKSAIDAMKTGAFDYLRKPFAWEEVQRVVARVRSEVRPATESRIVPVRGVEEVGPDELIGNDRRMLELVKTIGLLARSRVNVLIEGESGTGKELVARALHAASTPAAPFLAINCSAVVSTLFESELFGHEKGAFTGAETRKTGKLEHAGEGTLFLDEIGDLPADLQAKLLRVLQEKVFERVGGLNAIPFRARVVAATNRDLDAMVKGGTFRQDLFFRLSVSRLRLPPLRERRSDIPLLAVQFLARAARVGGREIEGIRQDALDLLASRDWPGNVRELENVLARAAALTPGKVIGPGDFETSPPPPDPNAADGRPGTLDDAMRAHLETVLKSTGWNITHAARVLEISPTTLRKKIADFDLRP